LAEALSRVAPDADCRMILRIRQGQVFRNHRCVAATNTEFARFLASRIDLSKKLSTALELCERLSDPSLPRDRTHDLIEEGNHISKMIYALMRQVDPGTLSR
jgi:hypothetical protein